MSHLLLRREDGVGAGSSVIRREDGVGAESSVQLFPKT